MAEPNAVRRALSLCLFLYLSFRDVRDVRDIVRDIRDIVRDIRDVVRDSRDDRDDRDDRDNRDDRDDRDDRDVRDVVKDDRLWMHITLKLEQLEQFWQQI